MSRKNTSRFSFLRQAEFIISGEDDEGEDTGTGSPFAVASLDRHGAAVVGCGSRLTLVRVDAMEAAFDEAEERQALPAPPPRRLATCTGGIYRLAASSSNEFVAVCHSGGVSVYAVSDLLISEDDSEILEPVAAHKIASGTVNVLAWSKSRADGAEELLLCATDSLVAVLNPRASGPRAAVVSVPGSGGGLRAGDWAPDPASGRLAFVRGGGSDICICSLTWADVVSNKPCVVEKTVNAFGKGSTSGTLPLIYM
jgi:hypothetical protein